MLPGRELINEIEQTLSDLDADEWELSGKLEQYILDNSDEFLTEWREIKHDYPGNTKEQLNLIFDVIQSEAYSESEKIQARVDFLDEINDELENLIDYDEEDI